VTRARTLALPSNEIENDFFADIMPHHNQPITSLMKSRAFFVVVHIIETRPSTINHVDRHEDAPSSIDYSPE
jgi:hypothetical protein